MMRNFCLLIFVLTGSVNLHAQPSGPRVDSAIRAIVTLCLAGGSVSRVYSDGNNVNIGTDAGRTVTLSREDAQGFVDGFPNIINNYSAAQAQIARECMRPYIPRIIDIILSPPSGQPTTVDDSLTQTHKSRLQNALDNIQINNIDYRFYHPNFIQSYGHMFFQFHIQLSSMGRRGNIVYIGEGQFGRRRFNVNYENNSIICEIGLLNGLIIHLGCV